MWVPDAPAPALLDAEAAHRPRRRQPPRPRPTRRHTRSAMPTRSDHRRTNANADAAADPKNASTIYPPSAGRDDLHTTGEHDLARNADHTTDEK